MFVKEKRKNIQYIALKNVTEKASNSVEIDDKIYHIPLKKSPIGLGFTLGTIESKVKDQHEIFVKMILDFSPAKYDGRLKVGDCIKKINNVDVETMTQADIVRIIRSIPIGEIIGLTISRSAVSENEIEPPNKEVILLHPIHNGDDISKPLSESKMKIFHFIIAVSNDMDKACYSQASTGVLGISVECRDGSCKDFHQLSDNLPTDVEKKSLSSHKNFYIKSILKNGSAHQDGRLKVGDEIMAVQGIDVQNGKIYNLNSKMDIYGDIFHFDLATVFIRNLDKLSKLNEFKNQFKAKLENPLHTLKCLIKEAGEMYSSISIVIKRSVSNNKGKVEDKLIHESFDSGKKKLNDLYRIENIFELNPDYRSNFYDVRTRNNRYKDEEFNEIHGRFHQERFIHHRHSDSYDEDSGFGWSLDNFYVDEYENNQSLVDINCNGKDELYAYYSKEEEHVDESYENNSKETVDQPDEYFYEPCVDIA